MQASQAIQTAQQNQVATKGQQQTRGQLTSFLVVDDQQGRAIKTTDLHTEPDKAVQPTVSWLCHR